jgi:outer membrane protein TolC
MMWHRFTILGLLLLALAPAGCLSVNRDPLRPVLTDARGPSHWQATGALPICARLLPPHTDTAGAEPTSTDDQSIDLETALALAGGDNPTIAMAREAVRASLAVQLQANALALPTLAAGASYDWHRGTLQAGQGNIIEVERQSAYAGAGAGAVGAGTVPIPGVSLFVNLGDAVLEPRATMFAVSGRQADAQATSNTILLEVTQRYYDLFGAEARLLALRQSEEDFAKIIKFTTDFAKTKWGRKADDERARAEGLLLQAAAERLEEEIGVAAAELARLIRLDPAQRLCVATTPEPMVELIDPRADVQQLVQLALANRPELAARSADLAVVQTRWWKEKIRPFLPTVFAGFSAGGFGGGSNLVASSFGPWSDRTDFDVSAVWTLQNFGFGNRAIQRRLEAEVNQANADRLRTVDAIATEVSEAHTLVGVHRRELNNARTRRQTADTAFEHDLKRAANLEGRPLELLDSAKQLDKARQDYVAALVGYNQAQWRLFVALGNPPSTAAAGIPCR